MSLCTPPWPLPASRVRATAAVGPPGGHTKVACILRVQSGNYAVGGRSRGKTDITAISGSEYSYPRECIFGGGSSPVLATFGGLSAGRLTSRSVQP